MEYFTNFIYPLFSLEVARGGEYLTDLGYLPSLSLQVASGGDATQGQVEIFSLNRPTPRPVKSLQVGAPVRCLEYVPEPSPPEEMEAVALRSPTGVGNTICLGLDDGR